MSTPLDERLPHGRLLRDGYVALPRFLAEAEIAPARAQVERLLRAPGRPSCERPHNRLVPLRWDDPVVERILASDRTCTRLGDALDADDLRWISGYVSTKEPGSPPLWWHQDWWCWSHPVSYRREAVQVAVLCYLTRTDERSGALRVLPGSHHRSTSLHAHLPEAHSGDAGAIAPTHPAMDDHPAQVTLPARPGDAVAIDYRLLHGTHANAAASRRDCLLLTFAPSWRALPSEIRGHLIRHPALPQEGEGPPAGSCLCRLLPGYDGARRDLPLNRVAPASFAIDERRRV